MDLSQARFNMVEQQVRPWEVLDQLVLDAMLAVPREHFVPAAYRGLAYSDIRIPLGFGALMFAPRWEGRLLQALAPAKHERALEIGTGSGYLSALLARLCGEVVSVDIQPQLVDDAARKLRAAGVESVRCVAGDALEGWAVDAPFDLIAVTASSPVRRPAIEAQLAPGGRLFMVIGSAPAMEARLITREGDNFIEESLFELELEPLKGAETPPRFQF